MINMKTPKHKELREDIKGYQWLLNEYKRISMKIDNEAVETGNQLMSMQAIKAFESKEQTNRRLHKLKMKYSNKIETVNRIMDSASSDRDYAVINCITDGMTVKDTAKHLNISRRTVYRIIDDLITNELKKQ